MLANIVIRSIVRVSCLGATALKFIQASTRLTRRFWRLELVVSLSALLSSKLSAGTER